jgi:hypothetical protein
MTMPLPAIVQKARQQLAALTGLPVASTVSLRQEEAGWCVLVEVVERKALVDSQDLLAGYELALDEEGNVLNFQRVGMRRRMDASVAVGAEEGA